jgi:5-methylcytosine-specific restriction endonuclease McrA
LPIEEFLTENSSCSRTNLKRRLLREGLLENVCHICGQLPEWNGKPLVLQLDHINGISNDNRLENLRIICPHCHSQTENFAGKNNKLINKK